MPGIVDIGANIVCHRSHVHKRLLEFDSVHGRWDARLSHDEGRITIGNTRFPVHAERRIADLPLDDVDVVIDCTGAFKTETKLAP